MDEESELRNPFPSPPSHYTRYSDHNLKLLALLRARQHASAGESEQLPSATTQVELIKDETDVPEWPLEELEKPRVDWILEDGEYVVFGEPWQVGLLKPLLQRSCHVSDICRRRTTVSPHWKKWEGPNCIPQITQLASSFPSSRHAI